MKARYHLATVSFSTDLVCPESPSVPIGAFAVGETDGVAVAVLAVQKAPPVTTPLPNIVLAMLERFPDLLIAQLNELLQTGRAVPVDEVLEQFEDSLRNSFHVSEVRTQDAVELQAAGLGADQRDDAALALCSELFAAVGREMVGMGRHGQHETVASPPGGFEVRRTPSWVNAPPEQSADQPAFA